MTGSDLAQQSEVEEDHLILATTLPDILNTFLERAALYSEMDNDAGEQDFVRLMTIHSAKGLEFKAVFLVGAEEGLFPGYRSMASESDIEEERRLAYVGITRARQTLAFTFAAKRKQYGEIIDCAPADSSTNCRRTTWPGKATTTPRPRSRPFAATPPWRIFARC